MMGDSNASIPTPEPNMYRPMFGSLGKAAANTSAIFVSHKSIDKGIEEKLSVNKVFLPVKNTRNIGKKDMKLNDFIGDIEIDPETYDVKVNGKLIESNYQSSLPMSKRYFLF